MHAFLIIKISHMNALLDKLKYNKSCDFYMILETFYAISLIFNNKIINLLLKTQPKCYSSFIENS